ncbi:response regulator [Stakelama tenebrarum]|uniref:Response regulator transcription factor n=1 Tax=Stakelama tenebrarum TaxID=2711215 RepID=A0A6G6Y2K6_9SPHN|nr:response regulator transcription factor [Sphingosinithalassobacter tenebrarum]QIG79037.1 response regulator transcription factor [Sphingosinithalassobacter tenebrarum]
MAPNDTAIRVLVVDDHMVVRAGLREVLGHLDGITVVGEAEDGEEALFLCRREAPHVILMDVRMAGMGGAATSQIIIRHNPDIRIIALSSFDDPRTVASMRDAGVSGFLPKSVSANELRDAILRVHAGENLFREDASRAVASGGEARGGEGALPPRQRRVLALLTKGFTNAEIADYLSISVPTARYHVSEILTKLGVSNRAEAAAHAVREKLIDEQDF